MSDYMYRSFTLACDGPACQARFTGKLHEARAAVRRRAAKAGWTHVRGPARCWDEDFCGRHKPGEDYRVAGPPEYYRATGPRPVSLIVTDKPEGAP